MHKSISHLITIEPDFRYYYLAPGESKTLPAAVFNFRIQDCRRLDPVPLDPVARVGSQRV